MSTRPITLVLALLGLAALGACGGGGGDSAAPAPTPPPPPPVTGPPPPVTTPSFVHLTSDTGDFVGNGLAYSYTNANALLTAGNQDGHFALRVSGDESWQADFVLPSSSTTLQVGTYTGLGSYPVQNAVIGGLRWYGAGRTCVNETGTVTITKVVYTGNSVTEIALQFTQYCTGSSAALHGDIYWNANDPTVPPGPTTPPAGLWQPAAGATPASGNYIYLESESGEYLGQGNSYLYTQANAALSANLQGLQFMIDVAGDQRWLGEFQGMRSLAQLATGYYGGALTFPPNNSARASMQWSGAGRLCNFIVGWFAIDSITFANGALKSIDLRFEQHCDGSAPAFHGKIHWDASDPTVPPGPQSPPPANLWQPAAGATPASGNYVYLESEAGDWVGSGGTYLYTQATAVLKMSAQGPLMLLNVNGKEQWGLNFQGMSSLLRLAPGYYGNLLSYPTNNPATGGLQVYGRGNGCDGTGWFVVDNIVWSGSTLVSVDLRFEQRCAGATPTLHGKLHWDSSDTTTVPGPATPPANLWQPAAGTTPASGNYVYLESQPGDYIALGNTYLYTQADAVLHFFQSDISLIAAIDGDEHWSGGFSPMASLTRLEPGFYNGMGSLGFNNPATGYMNWGGEGRGCNTSTGWFVVDSITYSGSAITAFDIRFEQHCEGGGPALHGKIHWNASDPTVPPGPVLPPPAGLWQPAPGVTPANGNFVYLQSDAGDYVGAGQNYLFTPANATLSLNSSGAYVGVAVGPGAGWGGQFQGMNSITRLQPGYYGGLQRYLVGNPAKGGLEFSGQGRGCNSITGWFVIDSVTYTGSAISAIDLRFEQHCDGLAPALHGKIHWGP